MGRAPEWVSVYQYYREYLKSITTVSRQKIQDTRYTAINVITISPSPTLPNTQQYIVHVIPEEYSILIPLRLARNRKSKVVKYYLLISSCGTWAWEGGADIN